MASSSLLTASEDISGRTIIYYVNNIQNIIEYWLFLNLVQSFHLTFFLIFRTDQFINIYLVIS